MARKPKKPIHPVTQYARDVSKGKIPANKWVRLACKRHLQDIKTGKKRGIYFDERAADHIIEFFENWLVFYEGEFDGKPFLLEPWEKFIVGSLFGWKGKDGYRRFRTAFIEIGKGNGKSPIAAGIGLYGLTFDGEAGSEVYSAATTREQAGILFRDAKAFVNGSDDLLGILTVGQHNIAYIDENSFFRPVSSEHRGLDGKRPHIALIDEIHEHPNDIVVNKIRAGTKGRRQALIVEITNSGHDRHSICFQHHEYTEKILEGTIKNDTWFGYITGLDVCEKCTAEGKTIPQDGCPDCDDWRDKKTWCLAGNTEVYAKIDRGITVVPIQYLCECYDLDKITLWDGRKWVKFLGYSEAKRTNDGDYEIELRSGQKIGCTAHHCWPTKRGKIRTDELKLGDIISTQTIPPPEKPNALNISNDLGWLIGLYLAEGTVSTDKRGGHCRVQLHGHENEMDFWVSKIKDVVESFDGTIHIHKYKNRGVFIIESPIILAIIKNYIGGNKASNKYFKPTIWRKENSFLKHVMEGYLEGDGGFDKQNNRYRLGFTRNYRLANGFRTLAARLDTKISLRSGSGACNGKKYPIHRGEWRWKASTYGNSKESGEVVKIGKSKARRFFHIGVDNSDGLFALASGVMTYNSKANPNLGVSIKEKYLKEQVDEAIGMPSKENIVKRLNFNIWTESISKWIPTDKWNACGLDVSRETLKGCTCFGGLDLSSNIDLTAWILLFPPVNDGDPYAILCKFFLPEDNMMERVLRDKVPYDVWARQGYITLTPGNIIDYDFILAQIEQDMTDYEIKELAFDRWGSAKITTDLQDLGFSLEEGDKTLIQFGQGYASMSAPTKEVEKMVLSKELAHGNNPVLAWNVSNVAIRLDPAENKKPDKEKSTERIDGAVALVMAIGRAMLYQDTGSVYDGLTPEEIMERMTI